MAQPERPPRPSPPSFEIDSSREAVYVNLVRIAHTPSEILLDFARILPGQKAARVLSQVLMSPLSAKLFFRALGDNLSKFEATFGEIRVPGDQRLVEYSKLFRPPEPTDDQDPPEEQ